jgi:diketogulonate reductase-like aldo/keto reductase
VDAAHVYRVERALGEAMKESGIPREEFWITSKLWLSDYANGLIRQYIPKKQDFKNFSDRDINLFQSKINRRPGKLLNFDVPIEWFYKKVALAT